MIVLPDFNERQAWRCAEEIRRHVAASPVTLPGPEGGMSITATLSIGVAIADGAGWGEDPKSLAEMIQDRADRALMAAKSLGRNRVMLAQAERAA